MDEGEALTKLSRVARGAKRVCHYDNRGEREMRKKNYAMPRRPAIHSKQRTACNATIPTESTRKSLRERARDAEPHA